MSARELIASPINTGLGLKGPSLSEPEKAAIIISLLGAESAGPVVEKIEDSHLRAFMTALESIHQIPHDSMLEVVTEFISELQGRKGSFKGGSKAARQLVRSMFPEERVNRLFGAPPPPQAPRTSADKIWAQLSEKPAGEIAKYLAGQQSRVSAIILSQLSTGLVGEILAELPEDISVSCVSEMSSSAAIEPRAIEGIAELVELEFFKAENADPGSESAVFVGEVLGVLPRDRRVKMLESLEKSDPKQAARVRDSMFTFEDLKDRLPVTAIPMIFRDFDQIELVRMLKAGAEQQPDIIEFLYANISQRMENGYKDQVDEIGDLTPKQGDAAIASLMSFIGQLEKEGRVTLLQKQVDEAA